MPRIQEKSKASTSQDEDTDANSSPVIVRKYIKKNKKTPSSDSGYSENENRTSKTKLKSNEKENKSLRKMDAKSKSISKKKEGIRKTTQSTHSLRYNVQNKSNLQKKGASTFLLHNVLRTQATPIEPIPGITFGTYSAKNFKQKDGIEAIVNTDLISGILKIEPGHTKKTHRSRKPLEFLVMSGKAELMVDKEIETIVAGSIVNIPKGVKYGIKNTNEETCYIHFWAIET